MTFEFGDVVLIPFPFTDQSTTKKRPAVVVSTAAYHRDRPDLIVLAVTSQIRQPLRTGEALLVRWQSAGLPKPSMLKPVVATVEQRMVIKKIGRLDEEDLARVTECLQAIVGP